MPFIKKGYYNLHRFHNKDYITEKPRLSRGFSFFKKEIPSPQGGSWITKG